jgi:hypothetical protein
MTTRTEPLSAAAGTVRLNNVDRLRAVLTIGVIATHATITYSTFGSWFYQEPSLTPAVEAVVGVPVALGALFGMGLSNSRHIKVQQLAVIGPQNAANALTYFNTLGVRKCTVIIAAGDIPVAAMAEGYAQFPSSKHVAIGGDPRDKPLIMVDGGPPATVQARIRELVAKVA